MNYRLHYWSADGPHESSTWSVYREEYHKFEDEEPIDGLTVLVSTWPDETQAQAEANRLQRAGSAT